MSTPDYFARKPAYHRTRTGGLTPNERSDRSSLSPRTPTFGRTLSSQYASPGAYRGDEESIIYAIGARSIQVGFPGEPTPRAVQTFGPGDSRRVDDFRRWDPNTRRTASRNRGPWGKEWELWGLDTRNTDLGLVGDKVERAVRTALTKYLLLDQRSRRAMLALPNGMSDPLLYIVLKAIFSSATPSSVSIWPNPLLATIAAGLRSSLVIDIGWEEVSVSAVYEYRQVLHRRSVRAAKHLVQSVAQMLQEHTGPVGAREEMTFDTAEDIMERMAWCKMSDDSEDPDFDTTSMSLPIRTASGLSTTLRVPFGSLAEPVERTCFEMESPLEHTDDHDLALHHLAYRCLLALPLDVRSICMSRIVITGGVSNIPGLKPRLLREIEKLVKDGKWDPVMNYGSARKANGQAAQGEGMTLPTRTTATERNAPLDPSAQTPFRDVHEKDDISEKLAREAAKRGEVTQGVVRGVETLGVWAGVSMAAHLKVEGMLEVRRDEFLRYGLASLGDRLDVI
ncbi:hypothetical protein AAFC00_004346 [Neodothiora populina]|uniref:Actin-like ATPase domain-containing protein n=1 Tax=Neodothiora populina TaxID=2781224 RepID=A0ABR3PJE0_9PEZI